MSQSRTVGFQRDRRCSCNPDTHFIDLDTNLMKHSLEFDNHPAESFVDSIMQCDQYSSDAGSTVKITHSGRSFRASFSHEKYMKEEDGESFGFIIPNDPSDGPVLNLHFWIQRGREETCVSAYIHCLDVNIKCLASLDQNDRENGQENQDWSTLPHAGTYFMRMTGKLFQYLRVNYAELIDESTLPHSEHRGFVPYTPLRFFLGKGSWYENFGYFFDRNLTRESAQEQLKVLQVSDCINISVLPKDFPPPCPKETVFEYFARFAKSDLRLFSRLYSIFSHADRSDNFRSAFNLGTRMIQIFEV